MQLDEPGGYLVELSDDVRRDRSRVLVVVGAGVSLATTGGAEVASWTGLLRHGVNYCVERDLKDADWARRRLEDLAGDDLDEVLSVAEQVERALRGGRPGLYGAWLAESVGALKVVDDSLIRALEALGVTLATTNYDDLLEKVTGRATATWQDVGMAEQVLRGEYDAILHLHGFFRRPETTVLGVRSYADITSDQAIQSLLRGAFRDRTLVFVGCGAGLDDPNLGALRAWLSEAAKDSPYHHYRLVTRKEKDEGRQLLGDLVAPAVYGERHEELSTFLRGLGAERRTPASKHRQRPVLELTVVGERVTAIARPVREEKSEPLNLDPVRATMAGMLEDRLRERDDSGTEEERAEARLLGRTLYDAVLTGEVRKLYERRRGELARGERLTVLLRVAPRAKVPLLDDDGDLYLASLPWEVLYGPEGWLARDDKLTLLRALPGPSTRMSLPDERGDERLRVLVINVQPDELLQAAATSWPPGKLAAHTHAMRTIRETLDGLRQHPAVERLDHLDQPTPSELQKAFLDRPADQRPSVIHYVGYGMQDWHSAGKIALLNEDRTVRWETYADFANRCQGLRPRLVFLHLCEGVSGVVEGDLRRANFTLLARALLEKGAQLVVAMQYPLLADVGATFTERFYASAPDSSITVGEAVQRARTRAAEFYRLGGPVLYLSQSDDAALVAGGAPPAPDERPPSAGQVARRGAPQHVPAEQSAAPPTSAVATAAAGDPAAPGQRTFAGLRLLARPVARRLGIAMSVVEPLLAAVWQECGSQQNPVSVSAIQNAIAGRYQAESDERLQRFWEEFDAQLTPGADVSEAGRG